MKKLVLFAISAGVLFASLAQAQDKVSDDLINYLYGVKALQKAQYAPIQWKEKFAGYSMDAEFNKAITAAQTNPNMTIKEAQKVLRDYVYALRDYHTSIRFYSTESATLPFTVKGAGDQYFIMYIDRTKLPVGSFPFDVGDELVTFDGKDTGQAVAELQGFRIENVAATDKSIAEMVLTGRSAASGYVVPQGAVTIGVRQKGQQKIQNFQLSWDYTPEQIHDRGDLRLNSRLISDAPVNSGLFHLPQMTVDVGVSGDAANPYGLGGRRTFTPDLGLKVWESPEDNTFYAYTYMTADRKLIGYVRIPSYMAPMLNFKKALQDFAQIISVFQSTTDSMIIDQVDNPGGSVYYLYGLASMLTDQPLVTPQHRMTVDQSSVAQLLQQIPMLESIKNDADAKSKIPASDLDGYEASYEFARFSLSFARFMVSEWNAGRKLTTPYWIGGMDHINPNPVHYTKPILLLVNHLDFSGGDFFPTIMQDNKRVTVMGSRTAGAGGYVIDNAITNNLGVQTLRFTGSIAARVDGNPIENLGVKPDIEYEMTPTDYQTNFAPYVDAIQKAVKAITP